MLIALSRYCAAVLREKDDRSPGKPRLGACHGLRRPCVCCASSCGESGSWIDGIMKQIGLVVKSKLQRGFYRIVGSYKGLESREREVVNMRKRWLYPRMKIL